MENIINAGEIMGALLLGATIGGLVGAALELIFEYDNGNETRKKLLAQGGDLSILLK